MALDNRTIINDCEANTGWSGTDAASTVSGTGEFYEGSGGLSWQASNSDDYMATTQDSAGMGTFALNWSDSTLYLLVKDNLVNTAANGGVQFVVGDGTDTIGYDVGGNDAQGIPGLGAFFNSYKLDMSNRPASFTTHAGAEGSLTATAITTIGYGCLHLAKANGPSDNVFMDCFRYIANGSYALTINGGTSGTPEDMPDVVADDVTNGWGLVSNPVGSLYYFFGPTEWGTTTASNSYFEADSQQWFWLGDNGGGHAVGATHFPMRIIGGTGTNSCKWSSISIINTGTGAELDMSSTTVETIEITSCSFEGLATFDAVASGGTSRFITTTSFANCGRITVPNGSDFNNNTISFTADATAALDCTSLTDLDTCTFVGDGTTTPGHAVDLGNVTGGTVGAPLTYTWSCSLDNGANQSEWEGSTQAATAGTQGDANDAILINVAAGTYVKISVASGATIPTVRNTGTGFLEISANEVTLTITVTDIETGLPIEDAMVYCTNVGETATYIDKVQTNASGQVTDTRSLGSAQTLSGNVRAGTPTGNAYAKYYKSSPIAGTYSNTENTNITVQLIPDE